MNKKFVWIVTLLLLAAGTFAQAQQPAKVHRVGRLSAGSPADPLTKESFETFRQGLHDLGWIEGRNIALEPRWVGLSLLAAALDGKRLELLKEVVPGLRRVAVLQNPDFPEATNRWRDAEAAGKSLGVRLQAWEAPITWIKS